MALKLVVTTNVDGDVFELLLKNPRYSVGRRNDNDLRVKETYISSYHAELVRGEDGEYYLSDLDSSNGTFLNGRRIVSRELVKAGDFIKFGILKVAVQEHSDGEPKIVSLKDRPAFAKKNSSNTAAIAVEKSTGPVATLVATPPAAVPDRATSEHRQDELAKTILEKDLAEWKERFQRESEKAAKARSEVSELETKLRAHEEELSGLRAECKTLAKQAEAGKTLDSSLSERESELKEVRRQLESVSEELADRRRENAARDAELETLRQSIAAAEGAVREQSEKRAVAERDLKAAALDLESRMAELAAVVEERDHLRDSLTSKEGDLAASAKEVAKLALLATTVATLESRLADAQARTEESRVACDTLSASLRDSEMQWQTERKTLAAAAKEQDRDRAKREKSLAALESKLAKQTEELASRKQKAEEHETELRSVSAEAEARIKTITAEKHLAEEQSERLSGEISALRTELSAIAAESEELKAAAKQRIHDLQSAKAESNELRMELRKTSETSASTLRETESTLNSRIAALETALDSERLLARDAAAETAQVRSDLASLRSESGALREENAQLRLRQEESAKSQGRLQAELNRESTARTSTAEALEASRIRGNELVAEVEALKLALEGKDRLIAEREQQVSRSESEAVQRLKRELSESLAVRDAAEEKSARIGREKQTLAGAFERLKGQFDQVEADLRSARAAEEESVHARGLLARRLEKAEASNGELAARIREEAQSALASKVLIEKLELQIRENESEAVQREREQVDALRADLSRASRRSAEDERRLRELEAELMRVTEARRQAEERILSLESRLLEQETETLSTRSVLDQTERTRLDLASRLAAEAALVATHLGTINGLRRELSETISRFTQAESDLIARHGEESDALLGELRTERGRREQTEVVLRNTREGLSDALRNAREESVRAQAKLLADSHKKLSLIEEELSASIRAREAVEAAKNQIEDELNQREEEIERLSERLEDVGLKLEDEITSRCGVQRYLETTRAGFSETLRAGWSRLAEAGEQIASEATRRRETETLLAEARLAIENISHELEGERSRHCASIREWEDRYETLREEKLTLACEDADLRKIRDEILTARETKRTLEDQIAKLGGEVSNTEERQAELRLQREHLLAEREELKAALNAARLELGSLQKRCADSKDEEAKQVETIAAAERRIQSLRKLEAEIELAVERRRQQALLNRGEVFRNATDSGTTARPEFSQEDFYRKLIARLDLIDDLAKRYENKWLYPKVAEQLAILKRGFIELLHDHSVRPFDLEPGTVLSLAERKRIKLVPLTEGGTRKTNGNGANANGSRVVETIRPGYVFQNGNQDVIIRKAEVLVS